MTLIKSISGIRGTIGGVISDNLTPIDIVKFSTAYALWLKDEYQTQNPKVVIGRDARISGEMVNHLVIGALLGMGVEIIDLGLSTTPTVEVAVPIENAQGGIILTASHNPKQWNALKLLNNKGEFISGEDGAKLLQIAEQSDFKYNEVDSLGKYTQNDTYLAKHTKLILDLPLVNTEKVKQSKIKVVVDAVNSTGGIYVPYILEQLDVEVIKINCEPNGVFPHNPEPLPEHLVQLSEAVKEHNANMGITVDPDVDRLAFVCEDGSMFGEEYTLVAVADYILKHTKGNTVSNLSSTKALQDVTEQNGGEYQAAAVGEVNVVKKMKEVNAVIGGEGNGGVIYPELHYGRDALVGIALFLSHYANLGMKMTEIRNGYPKYVISKNKIQLTPDIDVDRILVSMKEKYQGHKIIDIDGVKIYFGNEWVHLRKSNTEPIIRIYSESESKEKADALAFRIMDEIKAVVV